MSETQTKSLLDNFTELEEVLMREPHQISKSLSREIKATIRRIYKIFGFDGKPYLMNWGISDKKLLNELKLLTNLDKYYAPLGDTCSFELVYYMVRQLVKSKLDLSDFRILDVSCGNGTALILITDLLPVKKAIGIDFCEQQIVRARECIDSAKKIEFFVADAEKLPFKDASFDLIINLESSHCYPSPSSFFTEVSRILKPKGYFSYADLTLYTEKKLPFYINSLIKSQSNIKLVKKENLSKKVRAAIINRIVNNEDSFIKYLIDLYAQNIELAMKEAVIIALLYGAVLIPPKKLKLRNERLKNDLINIFNNARKPPKDFYMYYLLQKG